MTIPKSHITKYGYRRLKLPGQRKHKMEHVYLWELENGPVPDGMELHHRNGNKLDNRLENLQLVTRLEHKRIHSGCVFMNGEWWKPCRICGLFQQISDAYYRKPDGIMSICKRCAIRLAVEYKRKRKTRRIIEDIA